MPYYTPSTNKVVAITVSKLTSEPINLKTPAAKVAAAHGYAGAFDVAGSNRPVYGFASGKINGGTQVTNTRG